MCTHVDIVHSFDRSLGVLGLIKLGLKLRKENFSVIYDAHTNIRSLILKTILRFQLPFPKIIVRSKDRVKRFLLFKFRVNLFPKPFRAVESYWNPIKDIFGKRKDVFLNLDTSKVAKYFADSNVVTIAPSAAWELKRWPISHWKKLIEILDDYKFVILGGPDDTYLKELEGTRVLNLAGKLTLIESCAAISCSNFVISGDTGLLQVADLLKKNTIALFGPTAFGFPTNDSAHVAEIDLDCRPCTKEGNVKCTNVIYQKCMVDITPESVSSLVRQYFFASPKADD